MRINGEYVGIGGSADIRAAARIDVHADPTFDTVVARIEAETAEPKVMRVWSAAEINAMIAASQVA